MGKGMIDAKATYLVQLEWCTMGPTHPFVYYGNKVANLACFGHVHLSNTVQGLFRGIKVFEENHY